MDGNADTGHPDNFRSFMKLAFANRSFVTGFTISVIITLMAFISLFWTPYDVTHLPVTNRMAAPSAVHWLGTDHFGRDILSMIMIGAQNSIAVALFAVSIAIALGVPLGCWAAAKRGWIDEALMRFNDVIFAFPALLSAVMIAAIFGPGVVNAIIAIGIFYVPVFARIARAGALSIWPREYILAARSAGKNAFHITLEHILPNIANILVVQGTIVFALGIFAEAALSYVGLGAQPPMPSWGRMLFDAQTRMIVAPHLAIFPGLAIVITVLSFNLLGDGLRDILDPKLRRER